MSAKAPSTHPVDLFEPLQSAPRPAGTATRPGVAVHAADDSRSAFAVRVLGPLVTVGRVSRSRCSWRVRPEAESLEDGVRTEGSVIVWMTRRRP
jgi:hypothetical protein